MADPTIEAARTILDASLGGMRAAISGLTPEALSWRPAGDETNPMTVLTVHALHATRWWLLIATGASLPDRDRDAEFRATPASVGDLESFFDGVADECRAALDTDDPFDAGVIRTDPRTGEQVTAAWALLHAIEHLQEHVGHTQLTRQLWDAHGGAVR
jgi:Protein of unknown function (DUF664)